MRPEDFQPYQILRSIKAAGFVTFEERRPYDLNIFGIRASSGGINSFNDIVGVVYRDESLAMILEAWQATTDPGLYYLLNPMKITGTAILVPGQYRGVYKQDLHAGKYKALCQRNGPVTVYRDNDRDSVIDDDLPTETGMFGVNLHHASYTGTSTEVNKWSAGCQVIANISDFNRLMELSSKQIAHDLGGAFTYTLLTESQILPQKRRGATMRRPPES